MLKNKMLSAMGGAPANYIEDVFSTWLYTGNGSTQTINNGIDFSGKGGMLWVKQRSGTYNHAIFDTARTSGSYLSSNTTSAQGGIGGGFSLGSSGFNVNGTTLIGESTQTYASWTFRKQPKFFDVVTYTGDGTSNRPVAHSLASVPGCIIIKSTGTVTNWMVWHRSLSVNNLLTLNSTAAQANYATLTIHDVTSTNFQVDNYSMLNASGVQYVAYVFAHDAGGFGLTGTDNVISCGSYTGNGSAQTISLGYEPQWVMIKSSSLADTNWTIFDSMRGIVTATGVSGDAALVANTANAEVATDALSVTATGFIAETNTTHYNRSGQTYIYIAIRRGPMKTPTTGTSVFNATLNAAATNTKITTGFVPDTQIMMFPPSAGNTPKFYDRLRGVNTTGVDVITQFLQGASTAAEASNIGYTRYWQNDGYQISSAFGSNQWVYWTFGRAPGFFDEVCYTGDGTTSRDVAHNLGVTPELFIVKNRGSVTNWNVYSADTGAGSKLELNTNIAKTGVGNYWGGVAPTATTFHLGSSNANVNGSGSTYVTYLFATCPGVSKVGSYTGTGTTLQINCGFTGGARFVLIKRTDSTGDWYVWDSARGIVAGNDPYLLLNSTAAEVTTTDYVDTFSSGFEISSTAPAAINASGGTFIFLAIA